MRYVGGKKNQAPTFARRLSAIRRPGQEYHEPFCGMASVLAEMPGHRIATDANPHVIALLAAVRDGWDPPTTTTPEQHAWYKDHQPVGDPLTAFYGFGVSYCGQWFCTYAAGPYTKRARDGLLGIRDSLRGVAIEHADYRDITPVGRLLYLDPPYEDTEGFRCPALPAFSIAEFWRYADSWSDGNSVVVSGYQAPPAWATIGSVPRPKTRFTDARTEYLYMRRDTISIRSAPG